LLSLWRTTVGKKALMAISGFILVGFVIVHMLGNLKIFLGAEDYNAYAGFLRKVGSPALPHASVLWIARTILIAAVVIHVLAAVQLWLKSRAARPIAYSRRTNLEAGYSPATMRWGGIFLVCFVAYHLLHFTFGVTGYGPGEYRPEDVYRNVVTGFSVWYISAFYIAGMVALGLHLYHGIWSMFQTLGLNDARFHGSLKALSVAAAVLVAAANISFPVAVLAGILRLTPP
jgi:succinate dehydrogenase / fumarate reductase, cytochrome b subunit